MFMPKKNRIAIYSYLFKEGVIAVEKDSRLAKHHVLDLPNIHALDALKSLKSRDFVREVFNWQWHYYFLTDKGVEYLRSYLHLDTNVVPATQKKPAKPIVVQEPAGARPRGFGRGDKGVAPGEFKPRFGGEGGYRREGGFGRGRREEGAAPAPAAETTA